MPAAKRKPPPEPSGWRPDQLLYFLSESPPRKKKRKTKNRIVGRTPDGTELRIILER